MTSAYIYTRTNSAYSALAEKGEVSVLKHGKQPTRLGKISMNVAHSSGTGRWVCGENNARDAQRTT